MNYYNYPITTRFDRNTHHLDLLLPIKTGTSFNQILISSGITTRLPSPIYQVTNQ